MIDETLVAQLARELGGVELARDSARAIAADAAALVDALRRERGRLEFEDAPHAVEALRRP